MQDGFIFKMKKGNKMCSTILEKVCQELENSKVLCDVLKSDNLDMRLQMDALARDLRGVARIIDVIHNVVDYTDEDANISAFNNINRLISDIASAMEANLED